MISITNNGIVQLTLNFIASLRKHNYSKFLIFCLDQLSYTTLAEYDVLDHIVILPSSWTPLKTVDGYRHYGKVEYNAITNVKLYVVSKLLDMDYTVLLTDVDIVFLSPHVIDYIQFVAPDKNFIIRK